MNNHATIADAIRETAAAAPARLRLVKLVRISKDRDTQSSIANQHYDLDQYAERAGAEIVAEFVEVARSGWKDIPRPYLDDALAMVRSGLADGILVWKVSRFSRKGAEEIFYMLRSIRAGSGFLIATDDGIDTRDNDMAGIIKLTVIAELAKGESEQKSAFGKAWHRGRLRGVDGKPMVPNGKTPYGYTRTSANVLTINPDEAQVIRERMAKRILAGDSLRAIVRDLHAAGIPKPDAKGVARNDGKQWTHRGVRHILMNPTTTGAREIGGTLVDGDWQPVLDRETWNAVHARLSDPARRTVPDAARAHTWLLTGIAQCGRDGCEGTFGAKPHAIHGMRYSCRTCHLSIAASVADDVVSATVLDMLAGDGWRELRAAGRASVPGNIDFLTARLNHARTRWMDGKISDEEWDTTHDEINATIERIRSAPVLELPDVDDLAEAWNHPTRPLDTHAKRQVIRAATETVRILPVRKGVAGTMRVEVI